MAATPASREILKTEQEMLLLRLIVALGAAAGLYVFQGALDLAATMTLAAGYLAYMNYSLILRYQLLPRWEGPALLFGMLVVDMVVVTSVIYASNGAQSPFMILYAVFIVYYSIHLGRRGSIVAAGLASLLLVGQAVIGGTLMSALNLILPVSVLFVAVAWFSGYLGERLMHVAAEGLELRRQLAVQEELGVASASILAGKRGRVLTTVLFEDIVDSTATAAAMGDRRWQELLEQHHAVTKDEVTSHGGVELKNLGDGFLATFDRPAQAIACACVIRGRLRDLGIEIRAGLHTGEVEVMGDDVGGIGVHIGARVAAYAESGEVLVSGTVKDLVTGSDIRFVDRGSHRLKGVPGEWRLYAVDLQS